MKRYFENEDSNICYPVQYFQGLMKENGLTEMTVIEAIPQKKVLTLNLFGVIRLEKQEKKVIAEKCVTTMHHVMVKAGYVNTRGDFLNMAKRYY